MSRRKGNKISVYKHYCVGSLTHEALITDECESLEEARRLVKVLTHECPIGCGYYGVDESGAVFTPTRLERVKGGGGAPKKTLKRQPPQPPIPRVRG